MLAEAGLSSLASHTVSVMPALRELVTQPDQAVTQHQTVTQHQADNAEIVSNVYSSNAFTDFSFLVALMFADFTKS